MEARSRVVSDAEIADTLRVVLADVRQGIVECEDDPVKMAEMVRYGVAGEAAARRYREHMCPSALPDLRAAEKALLELTALVTERATRRVGVELCGAVHRATGSKCYLPPRHPGMHVAVREDAQTIWSKNDHARAECGS